MIWLLFAGLAVLALAPLAYSLLRPAAPRGRAEADLALYRAQRAELDREREAGRLDPAAHEAALLEVQRRLLAAPRTPDAPAPRRATPLLLTLAVVLPAAGLTIYLWNGTPGLPAAPFAERQAVAARDDALITQLRTRLERMDPNTEAARQGWLLLGNAERGRGHLDAAVEAWNRALAARFDPELAASLAELHLQRGDMEAATALLTRALASSPRDPMLRYLSGLAAARAGNTEAARATWRALLGDAPADAPWRPMLERQLAELP